MSLAKRLVLALACALVASTSSSAQDAARVLHVAAHHYPPLFNAPPSTGKGLLPDALAIVAKAADFTPRYHFMPFKRMEAALLSGDVDIVITPKVIGWRQQAFLYSQPLLTLQTAYFTLTSGPAPLARSYDTAANLDLVVILGDTLRDELAGRGILAKEVPKLDNAIRMLERRRVQALLSISLPVRHRLAELDMDLPIRETPVAQRQFFLASHRGADKAGSYLLALDRALARPGVRDVLQKLVSRYHPPDDNRSVSH